VIEVPSDDPLRPWRAGSDVPDGEATLWQEFIADAGGDVTEALVKVRREVEIIDSEALPYRAVELWSILVRRRLASGEPENDEGLADIRELAEAIRHSGNRRTLVPLFKWLFEAWRGREGEDGLNSATAKVQLGYATGLSGLRREGVVLLRNGLAATTAALGEKDRRTIVATIYLAETLDDLGENDVEPKELAEKALETARSHIGANDRLSLWCAQQLASILISFGERNIAISLTRTTLEAARATLGHHHVRTLILSSFLGTRLGSDGRIFEGFNLCIDALEGLKEQLGVEHPNTLTVLNHAAASYSRIGDSRRAKDLRSESLKYRMKVFGADHPRTWLARNDLGFAARRAGDLSTAMSMYQQVYDFRRSTMPDSRAIQLSINNLAFTLMERERYEEALKLFKLGYRLRRKRHGANKPTTVLSLKNLGLCLVNAGRPDEGLSLLLEALERRIALPGRGPDHQSVAIAWRDLAKAYRVLEHYQDAVKAIEQALQIDTAKRGENHSKTVRTTSELIRTLLLADQIDRAASLLPQHLQRLSGLTPGGLDWFGATRSAAEHTSALFLRGYSVEWVSVFRALGTRYVELIDLTDPEDLRYLRGHYARFHGAWLSLAIEALDGAEEIPRILSAISGRETAALVLADLEARSGGFAEGDSQRQYLEVLRELRRLRMMLRVQSEADDDGAPGDEGSSSDGNTSGEGKRKARLDLEAAERIRKNTGAFRADLVLRHDAAMTRYKALRAELTATDETFARAYAAPDTSPEALASLLQPGEGLALLFTRPGQEGEGQHHACVVTPDGAVTTVALPKLGVALSAIAAASHKIETQQIKRGRMRGGRALFDDSEPASASEVGSASPVLGTSGRQLGPTPDDEGDLGDVAYDLEAAMRDGLWTSLVEHLPDVTGWHIATHQELHQLPVHLGLDAEHSCNVYPGLVFFWLNRNANRPATSPKQRFLVHVDPATGSRSPIPFVEVEAKLLQLIWGEEAIEVVRHGDTIARLQISEPLVDTVVFVAHGDERIGPPRQTIIYADALRGLQIDAISLLSSAQRPRTAIASACVVGRVSEDMGGEPLGLVTAFFVSGGQFVVAPLQPVDDLFMPIFMGLFHNAWRQLGDQAAALEQARKQAISINWPSEYVALVQEAYRSELIAQLDGALNGSGDLAATDAAAERILKSWVLPRWGRAALKTFRKAGCILSSNNPLLGQEGRKDLVNISIERMLAQARSTDLTRNPLRGIVDWTVGYGG
jgi:tetratricopeptide (TPR) repeat protein